MTIYHGCRLASSSRSFSVPVCLRDRFFGLAISSHPLCDRRHSAPAYHPARLASWRPFYEQRGGTKDCGRTAQTRLDFTQTHAPGSRGNRTMGPTSAHSCLCRWSNFSHRVCCVHRIDSGLAGAAPFRSHDPLSDSFLFIASWSPAPTFPAVQSGASAGFVLDPVQSWNSGMRCNVGVPPRERFLHL